jgi:hypothetical protein
MGRGKRIIGKDEKGTRKRQGRKTIDDEDQSGTRKTEDSITT